MVKLAWSAVLWLAALALMVDVALDWPAEEAQPPVYDYLMEICAYYRTVGQPWKCISL